MNFANPRQKRFTLVEGLIALTIFLLVITLVIRMTLMGWSQFKSGQAQLVYQSSARLGAEEILQQVQNARSVSITSSGNSLYILNEDSSTREIYYRDADGDSLSVADNQIWMDPDPDQEGDERVLVSHISPLEGQAVFRSMGTGVAINFHVGDPPDSTAGDGMSGKGHQGAVVRLVAKPRNIGHVWTLNQNI